MSLPSSRIVRAEPDEADALTQIAVEAKSRWGYPREWMLAWSRDLLVSPEYIRTNPTYVARQEVGDGSLGFFCLELAGAKAVLSHLWVVPSAMRKGIGSRLFEAAEVVARQAGAVTIAVESDPNAEGFYERMGCAVVGRKSAPMENTERFLPLLEKQL